MFGRDLESKSSISASCKFSVCFSLTLVTLLGRFVKKSSSSQQLLTELNSDRGQLVVKYNNNWLSLCIDASN
jgi:hypothetical protein